MQRLSMNILTAIAVLALSGAGFTKPAPAQKTFEQSYYFYSAFDGTYNDHETTSYEIWEMEIYYDCYVSTNPAGGTLIEKGFFSTNPNLPAMVFLYAQFP